MAMAIFKNIFRIVVLFSAFFVPLTAYSGVQASAWVLNGSTPLMKVAESGDLGKVKELIANGVKVNEKSEYGATALVFASSKGQTKIIEYLLSKGADPNLCASEDMCPLWFAVTADSLESAELLIKAGADAKVIPSGPFEYPPLFIASARGNLQMTRLLLENGANVDEMDFRTGGTALTAAVSSGEKGMVLLLLKNGADPGKAKMQTPYYRNSSPLEYAMSMSYTEVVTIIEEELKKEKHRGRILNVEDIVERVYRDKAFVLEESYEADEIIKYSTKDQLRIIKNAIFARKNYKFNSRDLLSYYGGKFDKYKPLTKKVKLSQVDKTNLEYIKRMFEWITDRNAAG